MRRFLPLLLLLTAAGILCARLYGEALVQCGGTFTYALDDAYIHLALARTFVVHGVWGVTPHAYTNCASSILWPLLLAAGMAAGLPGELLPLLYNLLLVVPLLWLADTWLRRQRFTIPARVTVLALLLAFLPAGPLIFGGMEHLLQTVSLLWLLPLAARQLAAETDDARRRRWLAVAAALATGARYEGMFAVAAVVLLLLLRGCGRAALLTAAGGLLPLLAWGLPSLAQGWWFFPVSVLLKGTAPLLTPDRLTDLSTLFVLKLRWVPWVLVLTAATAAAALRFRHRGWSEPLSMALLFLLILVPHTLLARMGSYYRFEAHLFALGILALAPLLRVRGQEVLLLILLALLLPWRERVLWGTQSVPVACGNIRDQQVQMAEFLRAHYAGSAVVANDIGAICWYSDVRLVDLAGLGSRNIAQAVFDNTYGPAVFARAAAGAEVAVVYDHWYNRCGGLPPHWRKVAEWTIIGENVVCGGSTVSWYALTAAAEPRLRQALYDFAPRRTQVRWHGVPDWFDNPQGRMYPLLPEGNQFMEEERQ